MTAQCYAVALVNNQIEEGREALKYSGDAPPKKQPRQLGRQPPDKAPDKSGLLKKRR